MPEQPQNLGKLESVHGVSPVFAQRAVVVALLSFVFFLLMLVGFYIRQNIGYFLLSTAFLLVYILTMIGWLMHRKNEIRLYENGLTYKKFSCAWDEIGTIEVKTVSRLVGGAKINCELTKTSGEKIVFTETIHDADKIIERISAEIEKRSAPVSQFP